MINKLWGIFIILSISYGFLSGNIEKVNKSLFESIENTTQLIIILAGNMCFWSGIINILKNTIFIESLKKIIKPLIKFIFPEIRKEDKEYEYISMNIISNMIGLGNAATPCGLRVMDKLQEKNENKEKLSATMLKFILINTASIQIIPTTVISIRTSLGSEKPSGIMLGIWFSTIITFIFIIVISKIYLRFFRK